MTVSLTTVHLRDDERIATHISSLLIPAGTSQTGAVYIQGPPGPSPTGFGQIRYANMSLEPDDVFLPNVRSQVLFSPDPAQTQDFLNPPFADHLFWVNNTVIGRRYGDLIDILVNLLVTTQVSGGRVRIDIDVGSPLGPTGSDTAILFEDAGTPERVTFMLRAQTLGYFMANGAKLFLTSTVPLTTVSEAILIAPISLYDED